MALMFERFGDPATAWVVGSAPSGWQMSETVRFSSPQDDSVMTLERTVTNDAIDSLFFAQTQLGFIEGMNPDWRMFAGLTTVHVGGAEADGYVGAFRATDPYVHVVVKLWASFGQVKLVGSVFTSEQAWRESGQEMVSAFRGLVVLR
ncbi:hypothetical protein WJX64_02875 [Leifsonia sp. YIM 134122]|uniref:Uncharacterized protein n=1 Tax=Leifsonia stereocauli TaxID=3134136 RepID=A0ABU9W0H5_9MICO